MSSKSQRDDGETAGHDYVRKYVAFVDILGFADLVRRADREPAELMNIIGALETVHSVKPPTKRPTGLQAQNFSDSLILSAYATADGLWHLLLTLDMLSWRLLQSGILARGGVAVGGIHHDDRIVFGLGVNEAYRLESAVAKTPRVILSADVFAEAQSYAQNDPIAGGYLSRLVRDDDGVWFINYLNDLAVFAAQDPQREDYHRHPTYAVGERLRELLQRQLDDTIDKPDVYSKLAWMAKFWNRHVACPRFDGKTPGFERIRLAGEGPQARALPFRSY